MSGLQPLSAANVLGKSKKHALAAASVARQTHLGAGTHAKVKSMQQGVAALKRVGWRCGRWGSGFPS